MVVWKKNSLNMIETNKTCSQQNWFKILFVPGNCQKIKDLGAGSNSQSKVKSNISICMQCVFTHSKNKN